MERRFVLFLILSFAVLFGYAWLMQRLYPPRPRPQAAAQRRAPAAGVEKAAATEKGTKKPAPTEEPAQPAPAAQSAPQAQLEAPLPEEPEPPEEWLTLGSAEPDMRENPYRMLVTLTNRGAALARIELSSPRYCDIDRRHGYLGHLEVVPDKKEKGCRVQVVGPGTPAHAAGLKPGDIIQRLEKWQITTPEDLTEALEHTRPRQRVQLTVRRDGKQETLTVRLRRQPLEVVRPEASSPLSLLLTLQQLDKQRLGKKKDTDDEDVPLPPGQELEGVNLWQANWKLVEHTSGLVKFSRRLSAQRLEVVKTYRLAEVPREASTDEDYPAYHLDLEIEIRNLGRTTRTVAYRLDGPNGLPTEGKWFATKVSRNWGGAGLRDFVICFQGGSPGMIGAMAIADGKVPSPWPDKGLRFIGVDAQYFAAVLSPRRTEPDKIWFEELQPVHHGEIDPLHKNLVNTSCRLTSVAVELPPEGVWQHRFLLFAGPKKPALLAQQEYQLEELIYYGWPIFAVVAVPLTKILHVLYAVTHNYGLAIILLTALVRLCMFPLSRKQALGAQKMQELQPELRRIQEKYKNDVQARTKAQQELFRKHNYNPFSGCLVILIQLPIFIGLYRALMVDVELRDAPLLTHAIRWCSNLAAPDMLFDWSWFMPNFVNEGRGLFGLGPYFNLLPVLTIILFLWQQKMFMPPPADEQAAMQQKIMQYMMIFMGVLFFKVASGLCLYFIASSLWGLAERQFLPKPAPAAAQAPESRAQVKARARQK